MQNYVPDAVDSKELLEIAGTDCSGFDWEAVFKPDLIDDCDGFENDYFEEDLWDGEDDLSDGKEDLSNSEKDLSNTKRASDKEIEDEFRRKNRLFTILVGNNIAENNELISAI